MYVMCLAQCLTQSNSKWWLLLYEVFQLDILHSEAGLPGEKVLTVSTGQRWTLSGSELPVSTSVPEPCHLSRIWWEESAAEWARQREVPFNARSIASVQNQ